MVINNTGRPVKETKQQFNIFFSFFSLLARKHLFLSQSILQTNASFMIFGSLLFERLSDDVGG